MKETHASKESLSLESVGDYQGRMGRFDEYTVNFESIPAGFPPGGAAAFRGLPQDACQSAHWGYVFKGKVKFTYVDDGHEEIVGAGEAYYARPGHTFACLENAETVEFSPAKEFEKTVEVVSKNLEALSSRPGAEEERPSVH
jgi:hypothetical protein